MADWPVMNTNMVLLERQLLPAVGTFNVSELLFHLYGFDVAAEFLIPCRLGLNAVTLRFL